MCPVPSEGTSDDVQGEPQFNPDYDFTALAINDTFLVRFAPHADRILVMCFDEDVEVHSAEPTGLWVVGHHGSEEIACSEPEQFSCLRHTPALGKDFCQRSNDYTQWPKVRNSMSFFHHRDREQEEAEELGECRLREVTGRSTKRTLARSFEVVSRSTRSQTGINNTIMKLIDTCTWYPPRML